MLCEPKMRIHCGTFSFGVWVIECLSWRFELELESGIVDLRTQCGKFLTATSEVVSNMLFPIINSGNNRDKRSARGADSNC